MLWPVFIMSVAALGVFVLIWLRRRGRDTDRKAVNLHIARQQLAELKLQRERGVLDAAAFDEAYQELLLGLDADVQAGELEEADPDKAGKPGNMLVFSVIGVFVLFTVPLIYYQIGTPVLVDQATLAAADGGSQKQNDPGHNESLEVIANRLEARLANHPEDAKGWFLLGRTYMVMKNYPRAVMAMQKVYELHPNDATVLLSYADAIAMLNEGRVVDKAFQLAQTARELTPNDPTAGWLVAMGYENQGKLAQATQVWEQVITLLENDPPRQAKARQRLVQVRSKLQQPDQQSVMTAPTEPAAQSTTAGVTVLIKLAPELAQQAAPDDTVFVFARAAEGPRMPLAAQRLKVRDLPVTLTLDDSMAMSPMNKLSDHAQIYVSARVSSKGNAMPSSGDLQGDSPLLEPASQNGPVTITIDTKIN